jgi:hypothetical protein
VRKPASRANLSLGGRSAPIAREPIDELCPNQAPIHSPTPLAITVRTLAPTERREVLTWLDEAAAENEQAEAALSAAIELVPPVLSVEDVLAVVQHCGGLADVLHQATDEDCAALYEAIGVSAVYNAESNEVQLGVDPVASTACRRGVHTRMHTGSTAGRAGASETSEVEAQLFDGCHQLAVVLSVQVRALDFVSPVFLSDEPRSHLVEPTHLNGVVRSPSPLCDAIRADRLEALECL